MLVGMGAGAGVRVDGVNVKRRGLRVSEMIFKCGWVWGRRLG